MFLWPGLLVAATSLIALIDDSTVKMAQVMFKRRKFIWDIWSLKRKIPSINQLFLLYVKRLYGMDYSTEELPWKTYNDIRHHFQATWPYLIRIDQTTQDVQRLSLPDGSEPKECINFSSYSYLDAVKEADIRDFVWQETTKGNYTFGNHGPRMLGGNNFWLCQLESALASWTGREAALCFSSGFLACKSAIQSVSFAGDVIFADALIHESLRDGVRIARSRGVKVFYFCHNDMHSLDQLLHKHRNMYQQAIIVVESVYSMEGDIVDLRRCKELADQHDAKIILDEAHGMGVLGATGRGLEEMTGCQGAAWIICGSMTKALGSVGGYICASQEIIDFMHFFATGTMFSAPMSVPNAIAAYATLSELKNHPEWITQGRENLSYLASKLAPLEAKYGIEVKTDHGSPLIAFIFHNYNPIQMMAMATYIMKHGFYVASVNPPACPIRQPRFRITAPRRITRAQIDAFVECLIDGLEHTKHKGKELQALLNDITPLMDYMGI